jgi:hypothetical protein
LFYIPCIFAGFFDFIIKSFVYEYKNSSSTTYLLLLLVLILAALYFFLIPVLQVKFNNQGGKQLLNTQTNLNVLTTLSNYESLNGNNNPKYELPYVAKAYLQESNQLFVTRVLGLTGYKPVKTFAIKTIGGVEVGSLSGNTLGTVIPSTTGITGKTVQGQTITMREDRKGGKGHNNQKELQTRTTQQQQRTMRRMRTRTPDVDNDGQRGRMRTRTNNNNEGGQQGRKRTQQSK